MAHAALISEAGLPLAVSVEYAAASDTGRVRLSNEDSFASDGAAGLFVVADGLGGCNAGEVASAIAVTSVLRELRRSRKGGAGSRSVTVSPAVAQVCDAVARANREVFEASITLPHCLGMGSTLVLCWFRGQTLTVANIGDSRLYRLRRGLLEQLTVDHTVAQEQIDYGFISPEEARFLGGRSVLTRALGTEPHAVIDIIEQPVFPGDLYLMCSDGLYDMVLDDEILAILGRRDASLNTAVEHLLGLANARGGVDNITVILMRARQAFATAPVLFAERSQI